MSADGSAPQFLRRDFLVGSAAGFTGTWAGRRLTETPPGFPEDSTPSYAQSGEDVIAARILEHILKVERPTYLDIGAYLPICSSNTYLFYTKGGRGVLIEPNVAFIPELKSVRPRDTVLNVGVGLSDEPSADFYCLTFPQWNTFDKEEAERRLARANGEVRLEKVVKMPLIPVNRVLQEHFADAPPDFLSIDVEGLDLAILKTLDFDRFRPRTICAETMDALSFRMKPEVTEFLATQGYEPRAVTFGNTIYVDRTRLSPS